VGGSLEDYAGWLIAALLLLMVLAATTVAVRRTLLDRGGGTVECGLRRPGRDKVWRLGVASYQTDELRWHQIFGFLLRPNEVFARRTLDVVSRRLPTTAEMAGLGPDAVVIECRAGEYAEPMELAMGESALTGFLAWLEAAPPGSHLDQLGLSDSGSSGSLRSGSSGSGSSGSSSGRLNPLSGRRRGATARRRRRWRRGRG
jgi:hypothetical protein